MRHLIARCLEKDRKLRLRDIGDARSDLDRIEAGEDHARVIEPSARLRWMLVGGILLTVAAAVATSVWMLGDPGASANASSFGQPRRRHLRRIRRSRVVSPDELNAHLRTAIVTPMTTTGHEYPWRIPCRFQNRSGFVALDQLRTVDRERLIRRLGRLSPATTAAVLEGLQEMFAE